jgi:hypothetical protein
MPIHSAFLDDLHAWDIRQGRVGGQIFILDYASNPRKFPSDPRPFSSKNEAISSPPPCGFLIGIYLFYKNWSTETFRKKGEDPGDALRNVGED